MPPPDPAQPPRGTGVQLTRRIAAQVDELLAQRGCVGLFGPRHVGKSSLARSVADGRGAAAVRLDLSDPDDQDRFAAHATFFAEHGGKLVVLDEVHRMPAALEVVRRRVESEIVGGDARTQFLLLGSSSGDLHRLTSEALHARVARVFVDPIHLMELPRLGAGSLADLGGPVVGAVPDVEQMSGLDDDALWLRGGFPESLLADSDDASFRWRKDYLHSCASRRVDGVAAADDDGLIGATLAWLAASPGGLTPQTGHTRAHQSGVAGLQMMGLVRPLLPWFQNREKQLTKRMKLYIRDTGLLHALRDCKTHADLIARGIEGASWEGFCIETLTGAVGERAQSYFYQVDQTGEIDLVLEFDPTRLWAIEIKHGEDPTPSGKFHQACDAVRVERRMLIHRGHSTVRIGGVPAFTLRDAVAEVRAAIRLD